MVRVAKENPFAVVGFLVGFYSCLVGSKIVVAVSVDRSRSLLAGRVYVYFIRILGVLLALLAVRLCVDGLGLLRASG